MKKCLLLVAALVLLCGIILLRPGKGQQRAPARDPYGAPGQWINTPYSPYGVSPAQSEIARLMSQLREADDEAKKAELTKKLEAAVAKHFDEDLKVRETELTKLEERMKKLQAQLERRRKAKAEIIQLQIKVLVNEAEGLGFQGASFFEGGRDPNAVAYPMVPGIVPRFPPATRSVPRQ